jgi:glycosyltransferase involved in cell wall biosynthesis
MCSTANSKPLLSIIIPTRDRAKYAIPAIRSILSFPSDRFELVVQDNSTNDVLAEAIQPWLGDARLVYQHSLEAMPMIGNFTKGLELSRGMYITYLGDDDGANLELIDAAIWAEQNDIDVLTTTRPAIYSWPDLRFKYLQKRLAGRLEIRRFSGKMRFIDPDRELRKCASAGGELYAARLPLAYYGIAKRECIERIKQFTGSYFPGPSPDLAIAIGLASQAKRVCQIDYPLFIPGISMGNAHAFGRADYNELRLETKSLLPKEAVRDWSPLVPAFFCGPTMWGETAVKTLSATGRKDILADFNISYLHAKCAVFYPRLRSMIMANFNQALRANNQVRLLAWSRFILGYISIWGTRAQALFGNLRSALAPNIGRRGITGLNNIEEAVDSLSGYLKGTSRKFGDAFGCNPNAVRRNESFISAPMASDGDRLARLR